MNMQNEEKQNFGVPILSWIAPEYVKNEKGTVWVTMAISITAGLIAYAILTKSWTMSAAFFMLAIVYFIEHKTKPENIPIEITEMGVKVKDKFYPFSHFKTFWIIYNPPMVKTLHMRFASRNNRDLLIQLGDQDPVKVRNLLLTQLPEWEGKEEAITDILTRVFKL